MSKKYENKEISSEDAREKVLNYANDNQIKIQNQNHLDSWD